MKVKLAVAFAVLLLTGIAQAQTSLDYDVTGSMSVTGPGATETVDFQFQFDYPAGSTIPGTLSGATTGPSLGSIVGPTWVVSTGPLTFTLPDENASGQQYIQFIDAAGDTYDLELNDLVLPAVFGQGSYLYSCESATCAQDFGSYVGAQGIFLNGTSSVTITPEDPPAPTPEPTTLILFGTGLLGFAAFFSLRRRLAPDRVENFN